MTSRRVLLLGLFFISVYLLYLVLKPLLGGIVWAVVLVVAFHPVYARLTRLLGGRVWLASILLSAAVATVIVLPISLAASRAGRALPALYEFVESEMRAPDGQGAAERFLVFLDELRAFLGQFADVSDLDLKEQFLAGVRSAAATLSERSGELLGGALNAGLTVFVMLVTMAFLFKESGAFLAEVRRSLPLAEDDKAEIFHRFKSVVQAVFYGVMLTALIQGIVGGIGCLLAGLPSPFTFGALMFFCGLLPVGGPVLVWLPAGIWLVATGKPVAGGFLLVWGALLVSTMDNILRPIFIGKRTRMHLLLISFGIFGGLAAFGFLGLFAGPLVIALFLFFLDVMRREPPPPQPQEVVEAAPGGS